MMPPMPWGPYVHKRTTTPFRRHFYKDSSRLQSARYGEGIRHAMHRGGMEHKHIYDVSV